ncbi:MAG TPA: hypothetical protein VFD32_10110 [Dehalococcoidia bacterium]|nr:hypothetical protein [Dehalococcoidia bacterium]
MKELEPADPCSLDSLVAAARRTYGEARTEELRSSLQRAAHACAALRDAIDPRREPAIAPVQERER